MEWQKYLPWIIGAAIVLFAISRFRSRTVLAPQTQFTQSPNVDPYLDARSTAFSSLVDLSGEIAAQDTIRAVAALREGTERLKAKIGLTVANKSYDTQVTIANVYANAANQAANLNFLQRKQDTDLQQRAIDRYYSSRTTDSIVGSIATTLGSIFGNRGGTVFKGTPPIIPGFTF
jgi:hypothetical protein